MFMFENGMECSIHYIILDAYLNVHQRPPPNAFTYMNRNVNSNRKQLMGERREGGGLLVWSTSSYYIPYNHTYTITT